VRHAGAQHAQLQLGRGGAQVEAGKVVGAVADDLVLADAQAADALRPSAETWACKDVAWALPSAMRCWRASTARRLWDR
jgi:hypothetical protein